MLKAKECWSWRKKIGYPAHTEGHDYYLGQLYFMDREIGLLLNQLDKLELTEKTAVFFISYNGGSLVTYANNGPLKGGKYTLFEGGTRVPLIVRIPENSLDGRLSSAMDLYPTICQLAGAEIQVILTVKFYSQKTLSEILLLDNKHEVSVRFGAEYLVIKKTWNSKLQIVETLKGEFLSDVENDLRETRNVLQNFHSRVTAKLKQKLKMAGVCEMKKFNIIEMLIVLAIIGVLVSNSFTFTKSKAREKDGGGLSIKS